MRRDIDRSMKEPEVVHYFVDEAGDPVLFDRKGRIRVGTEGCSKFFIVGKLDVADPDGLGRKLEALRSDLLADPYFKRIPSMQRERKKTAVMFHAKDDIAEVRREVFKLLAGEDLRFYAVVRDKSVLAHTVKLRNENSKPYRYNQNEQYDNLISDLFQHVHNVADLTKVCFARRLKKNRTAALYAALEKASEAFERKFSIAMPGKFEISCSTPGERPGLQAVDYYLWAVQRYYERGESRYLEYIWPQVVSIHALDEIADGRMGVLYGLRRPLLEGDGEEA